MGYSEYPCTGCGEEHDASAWWRRRRGESGWEYLCGEKYTALKDKDAWEHFESN